jgi:hypothetical protein
VKSLVQALRNPDQDGFARLFLGELKLLGRQGQYDKEQFALLVEPGCQTINLINFYREYLATPRLKRAELLASQVRSVLVADEPIPKAWTEARRGLLPLVRHRGEQEFVRYSAVLNGSNFDELISRPVSDQLYAAIAYDSPTATTRGSSTLLNDWGVSLQIAWDEALDNLRKRSPDNWFEVAPGVYQSGWQDVYDISRILLPDVIYRIPIIGRPVVFTPERNSLIVTGDRNVNQLRLAAERAATILTAAPRQLTVHPLVLDGGNLRPFELPTEVASIVAALVHQERAEQYEQARPFIEKILEARGQDIFVGSILAVRKIDNGLVTHLATWPAGCDTLLPVVDLVAMEAGDKLSYVPWSALKEAGIIGEPDGSWWPPRFRVKEYPEQDVLRRLLQTAHT